MPSSETPQGSESKERRSTPLKSVMRHTEQPESAGAPMQPDVDFQAYFPGWPKGYFMGILPVTSLGAIARPMGYPGYNYTSMEDVVCDIPFPNSVFKPTTPDPMYVACMPWCAYPYGVPASQAEERMFQAIAQPPQELAERQPQAAATAQPPREAQPQHMEESMFLAVPTPLTERSKLGHVNFFGRP